MTRHTFSIVVGFVVFSYGVTALIESAGHELGVSTTVLGSQPMSLLP